MNYTFEISRCSREEKARSVQKFSFSSEDPAETVASALTKLNSAPLVDVDGIPAAPIAWECSCLQKKCGACAMVINGRPSLACARKLSECGKTVRLEPLKKFPVVEDLIVDRSIMMEELMEIKAWLPSDALQNEKSAEVNYEASRCLQCGCCLEVCPNFAPGDRFMGMSAAVPVTRILSEIDGSSREEVRALYDRHIYEGCGKSLACCRICPAKIDIGRMLVNSNAAAVWKNIFGKRNKEKL